MWFLLHMDRKSYMRSSITPIDLTLNDLERSNSKVKFTEDLKPYTFMFLIREPSKAICYFYTLIGNHM